MHESFYVYLSYWVRAFVGNEHDILHIYYGPKFRRSRALVPFVCGTTRFHMYTTCCFHLFTHHPFLGSVLFVFLFVMYSSDDKRVKRLGRMTQHYQKQCMQIKYSNSSSISNKEWKQRTSNKAKKNTKHFIWWECDTVFFCADNFVCVYVSPDNSFHLVIIQMNMQPTN